MQGMRADIMVYNGLANRSAALIGALGQSFNIAMRDLEAQPAAAPAGARLSIFFANLASSQTFRRVKAHSATLDGHKIFVLPTHNRDNLEKLRDLGANDHFVFPLEPEQLRGAAKAAINRDVEASWDLLSSGQRTALKASLSCFTDCFEKSRRGEALPMESIQDTCHTISQSAETGKLSDWLTGLHDHHDYSFRHSMFVCGSLTYFANAIGFSASDLHLVTVGGLIHDVGKSQVPLEILDKPGKLEPPEWEIMRKHPEHSREILLREVGLDPAAIAMAVQHHEKLDGGGYPDGLSGAQINDHVRLTAISDVFSALIDKRSYKEPMSSEAALELMSGFKGHLDLDLLRAFREFVLDSEQTLHPAMRS